VAENCHGESARATVLRADRHRARGMVSLSFRQHVAHVAHVAHLAYVAVNRMRVLVQRVSRAEVRVDDRVIGKIGAGLLLLVGFTHADGDEQIAWMADKVVGLRIFSDDEDKMNCSLAGVGGSILVVSQFTLYGDAVKGRRPSFVDAARPEAAVPLYERFVATLRARGVHVETGEFGATMEVELVNDGPVTLWLER